MDMVGIGYERASFQQSNNCECELNYTHTEIHQQREETKNRDENRKDQI